MADKDTLTKQFMRKPEVFADAFNFYIYGGRQVIRPEDLKELDTTAIAVPYGSDNAKAPTQKSRDVLKCWVGMTDRKNAYLMLGVENQTNIHYAMPARNMLYDAIQYDNQIKECSKSRKKKSDGKDETVEPPNDSDGSYLSGFGKSDRLVPVITLVVYFGAKEWDAPITLHEMLADTDESVLSLVPDYRINLICPANLTPQELDKLTSRFREAMLFLKYSENKAKLEEIVNNDPAFQKLDRDTAMMLGALTKTKIETTGEGDVNMCLAIQEMVEESRAEGRAEGRAAGRAEGRAEERADSVRAVVGMLRSMNLAEGEIAERIQSAFTLTEEEIKKFMQHSHV